jgi:hypothetical protein
MRELNISIFAFVRLHFQSVSAICISTRGNTLIRMTKGSCQGPGTLPLCNIDRLIVFGADPPAGDSRRESEGLKN